MLDRSLTVLLEGSVDLGCEPQWSAFIQLYFSSVDCVPYFYIVCYSTKIAWRRLNMIDMCSITKMSITEMSVSEMPDRVMPTSEMNITEVSVTEITSVIISPTLLSLSLSLSF